MRRHLVLKAIGTSVIIGIFFFVYLHLLHHPRFPVTVMPATELDRLVPFQPGALFLYLTLWLYVGAGPGLQLRWRELISYAAWSVLLCAAGLTIFYLWHVAFASFTAIRIDQVLRATGSPRLLRAANLGWATAIVYSTLAIRQHVVVDVGAGLLLGTLFALASLRWGLALPKLHATGVAASAIAARPSDA